MPVIRLENISVIYRQRRERMLLREHLRELVAKMPEDGFYALHDVSFSLEQGESVSIIGANGAGKSTLLSVLAGLISPDKGSIEVNGRVIPLLELGGGFHPDLTGLENIRLNAALLGLSEAETRRAIDPIIEFSELAEFIDEPVRTYSSGMVLRLAFAVTMHAQCDILLLDEILAVGDLAFQKKCYGHIQKMRASGKTIISVSHIPAMLQELCSRAIWLHHGQLVQDGEFAAVSASYESYMSDPNRHLHDQMPAPKLVEPPAPAKAGRRALKAASRR